MADQDRDYLMARTGPEVKRLQMQHRWFRKGTRGKIVFAPVDLQKPRLRVLDVGCADGSLLRDLAPQLDPSASLVGVDLTASFLPASSGNTRYAVADVTKPFAPELQGAFDLTHLRYVLPAARGVDLRESVRYLASTLAPGGWLQVQEYLVPDWLDEMAPAQREYVDLLHAVFNFTVGGPRFADGLAGMFEEAGLVGVKTEALRMPIGKKMETEGVGDAEDVKASVEHFRMTIPGLLKAFERERSPCCFCCDPIRGWMMTD